MKLQAICPYCDSEEFDNYKHGSLICDQCGEMLITEELNLKIIEEN